MKTEVGTAALNNVPVHEEYGAVVVDVEEGDVVVLAPQDEEYRVLARLDNLFAHCIYIVRDPQILNEV